MIPSTVLKPVICVPLAPRGAGPWVAVSGVWMSDERARIARSQGRCPVFPLPVRDVRHPVTRCTGACARCQTPCYAMYECLCAMYGCLCTMSDTPLRDVRVPVHDVRVPVRDVRGACARCKGACARCQTPRYAMYRCLCAMYGCLCAMSQTPLRDVQALVRQVKTCSPFGD